MASRLAGSEHDIAHRNVEVGFACMQDDCRAAVAQRAAVDR
jgi:hypothetical protein